MGIARLRLHSILVRLRIIQAERGDVRMVTVAMMAVACSS